MLTVQKSEKEKKKEKKGGGGGGPENLSNTCAPLTFVQGLYVSGEIIVSADDMQFLSLFFFFFFFFQLCVATIMTVSYCY